MKRYTDKQAMVNLDDDKFSNLFLSKKAQVDHNIREKRKRLRQIDLEVESLFTERTQIWECLGKDLDERERIEDGKSKES